MGLDIMNYALSAITLLTLVFLVVSIWLDSSNSKFIYRNVKKNREVIQAKQAQVDKMARDFLKATQLIIDYQTKLDEMFDEAMKLVDTQNTSVLAYLKMFDATAKSDLLAARRDELIRTKELKVALERIMGMAMTSRQEPSAIDQLAMESIINRIKELEEIILNDAK